MPIETKSFLARYFCSHIDKVEREGFLRTHDFIIIDRSDILHPFKKAYDYYAVYKTCVKCGRTMIVEERRLHSDSKQMLIKD